MSDKTLKDRHPNWGDVWVDGVHVRSLVAEFEQRVAELERDRVILERKLGEEKEACADADAKLRRAEARADAAALNDAKEMGVLHDKLSAAERDLSEARQRATYAGISCDRLQRERDEARERLASTADYCNQQLQVIITETENIQSFIRQVHIEDEDVTQSSRAIQRAINRAADELRRRMVTPPDAPPKGESAPAVAGAQASADAPTGAGERGDAEGPPVRRCDLCDGVCTMACRRCGETYTTSAEAEALEKDKPPAPAVSQGLEARLRNQSRGMQKLAGTLRVHHGLEGYGVDLDNWARWLQKEADGLAAQRPSDVERAGGGGAMSEPLRREFRDAILRLASWSKVSELEAMALTSAVRIIDQHEDAITIALTPELRELLRAAVAQSKSIDAAAYDWAESPQGVEYAKGMKP